MPWLSGEPAAERSNYGKVVLEQRLRDVLVWLKPGCLAAVLKDAERALTDTLSNLWFPGRTTMSPVLEPYRRQIEALCRRFYVRRLEVFGSALRSDFNPARSDVDFLVEFDMSPDVNAFEAYFDLRRQLCELLGRPVDLVMLSAISNPYVRAGIEAQRELVYAA